MNEFPPAERTAGPFAGGPLATLESEAAGLADALIRSSVDGILAFDGECRYTIWNPAMERLSGVPASEALGRCAFDVFAFLKETGEDRCFYAALAGRTVVSRNRPYRVPETGRRGFFEGHYSPLRGEHGRILGGLAIVRDVTERVRDEERAAAFRTLRQELRAARSLEEVAQI